MSHDTVPWIRRNAVPLIASAAGGAGVVLIVVFTLAADGEPKAKARSRQEVEKLVVGKKRDEVLKVMGRPASTEDFMGDELWRYERASYDPVSRKVDGELTVWFPKNPLFGPEQPDAPASRVSFSP